MNNQPNNKPLIYLGKAMPFKGQYAIKKAAIIGYASYYMCPKCGDPVTLRAKEEGIFEQSCNHCNTIVFIKGISREKIKIQQRKDNEKPLKHPSENDEPQKKVNASSISSNTSDAPMTDVFSNPKAKINAKIVWGGVFTRKSYLLRLGENWIGRWDENEKSDIMVKDRFMSLRSACIEVIEQNNGFIFKFMIKKSTNPVKVNGNIIGPDQSIYLNYEDHIDMGVTHFIFKSVK